jgi:hypothetical protein
LIRGESRNVPEDRTIWVIIAPHDVEGYYPQGEAVMIESTGDWSTWGLFTTPATADGGYDVLAVLVDLDARRILRTSFARAELGSPGPELDELPDGVEIYDRITVFR